MDFKNKVVLITGASSGIGEATAKYLTNLGALLALTGRNVDNLTKVGLECEAISGRKPLLLVADVTKPEDNKRVIDEIIAKLGKLDVLVNNAGIIANGSIENTSLEQYDEVMNTNVKAVYHLTMLAVPHLITSKGNIVNLSSVAGNRSFPGILAYGMSKAAIDQFTRCTALELAEKQVRVNAVNPGLFDHIGYNKWPLRIKYFQESLLLIFTSEEEWMKKRMKLFLKSANRPMHWDVQVSLKKLRPL